jgi:hypothetical protein
MRWILLVAAVVGFAIAFTTASPGLMGVGLILGFIGLLGFAFALAAARIAQNAQPETTMIVDPEITLLRAKTSLAKSATTVARKPAVAPERVADVEPNRTA